MSDLFWGCPWVVGKTKKGKKTVDLHCNKLVDSGQKFCPKHILIAEDAAQESSRRVAESLRVREHRKRLAAELEASPLRADNPEFAKPKDNPMMEKGR